MSVFIISDPHGRIHDKLMSPIRPGYVVCMLNYSNPTHFSHRRSDDLQRMCLRVKDESVRAPVARDLEDAVLVRVPQSAHVF